MNSDLNPPRFSVTRISPVCWPWLTELGETGAVDDLAIWVDWVRDRYRLTEEEVPQCWDRHGALVEELSALRTAWLGAFAGDAAPDEALKWHEAFDRARPRLDAWTRRTGCATRRACASPAAGANPPRPTGVAGRGDHCAAHRERSYGTVR